MAYIFEALTASIFGLLLGSFAGAQVWRIRARQLDEDRRAGETIDKQELSRLKPLISVSLTSDRSVCLSCHHQLRWYDMIPLLSWASTGGRCRYCQQPIGSLEPLVELGLSAAFVISYLYWPTPLTSGVAWGAFIVWLLSLTSLAILVTYDIRWQLLPDIVSYSYMSLGII
ncbi:MAG: prepilin peptidase, partial [Candidatus Saccharimonas aalborgensis]